MWIQFSLLVATFPSCLSQGRVGCPIKTARVITQLFLSTFYLTFFKAVASKFQEHLWDEWQQFSLFVGGDWPIHSHPYGYSAFSWPETNCYKGPDPH